MQGRANGSGREVRITIGLYGVFTAEQARQLAREHLRNLRLGLDPRDLRREDETMRVTLGEVCETYVSRQPTRTRGSAKRLGKASVKAANIDEGVQRPHSR